MKRKGIRVRILSILLSVVLGTTTAFVPAINVRANPALWGIYELIVALAVSAGVSVSQYNISQGLSNQAEKELKSALIKQMPDWLKMYTTGAELTRNMIADGTLQTALEDLATGETYDLDGIGITKKDESNYALSMDADIVKGVAEQIGEWAESEANNVVMDVEVDYSSYVSSNVDIVNYSFDDLITNYSQVVYDAITEDGWDADNCCLLVYQFSSGGSVYNEFLVIPNGYTFINSVHNYNYTSKYSSGMQVVDTDIFFDVFRSSEVGMNNYDIRNYILNNNYDFPVYTYHFASGSMVDFIEDTSNAVYAAKIQSFGSTNSNVFKLMEYAGCYGYSESSNTHILHTLNCSNIVSSAEYQATAIKTMFPTVAAKYLDKTLDTAVDLGDKSDIKMDIGENTLPALEGTETITQYITYVTEQSIDLKELQDTIIEAEQNSAINIVSGINIQTQSLLAGIQAQTKELTGGITSVLNGVGDVMTDSLEYAFVPSDTVVNEAVLSVQNKFGFVNDIRGIIDNIKATMFGITPSPYLKIPIMRVTKSKYDWGTGDYIIIDASWYAEFKDFGDDVVSTFLWLFFLWLLWLRLPDIINGVGAGVFNLHNVSTYDAQEHKKGKSGRRGKGG